MYTYSKKINLSSRHDYIATSARTYLSLIKHFYPKGVLPLGKYAHLYIHMVCIICTYVSLFACGCLLFVPPSLTLALKRKFSFLLSFSLKVRG